MNAVLTALGIMGMLGLLFGALLTLALQILLPQLALHISQPFRYFLLAARLKKLQIPRHPVIHQSFGDILRSISLYTFYAEILRARSAAATGL